LTGDQSGGLGEHHVLHTGRTFLLGLDLLCRFNHRKCYVTVIVSAILMFVKVAIAKIALNVTIGHQKWCRLIVGMLVLLLVRTNDVLAAGRCTNTYLFEIF